MCDDCSPRRVSRRALVAAPAAASLAAVAPAPAYADAWRTRQICRAAWGADEPNGPFLRHTVERLTVHHSGLEFRDNRRAPATVRAIQADHQSRGWPDIAYHLVIDRHGHVYRGRPFSAVPSSATPYDPTGHLTVMCLGNFEVQGIPSAQLDALVNVLAWASARFGVAPSTIRGHRDVAATACPGDRLYRYIADGTLRRRTRARRGDVGLRLVCGPEGRRLVRRIEAGTA